MNGIKKLFASQKDNIIKFIKYAFTGGSAFIIEYLMYYILTVKLKQNVILSNAIVYTVTFWFVFIVNMFFTFNAKGRFAGRLLKYILLYFFNLGVTNVILAVLTYDLGVDKLVGKLIVSALIVIWNFPLYRYVIYK